ncbi:UDP-N-acetylmuramoyl-L-alanyl-D-glutamate--2,6-diaminopimelate ligase [Phytohalomonas tamaricis]|uniref:UDP-N-acetylmuramoyl-L-alanyl-D-glutamate--2, 6-diaminopimelate ligase n=1 Tax=Phytohalomonas tamaricis TaxID=2081032 RepID=UPI000D0AF5FB|nr:UDP-N-acetylmuramoyl-L-alanyl-D-glutamate--2,6-diaminopimelate ligase [Phytohalomonas tamaricis]
MNDVLQGAHLRHVLDALWPGRVWPELRSHLNLHLDSRRIVAGDVFIAIPGTRQDGRDYIDAALASGAALVLAQAPYPSTDSRVMVSDDVKSCLGELAHQAFAVPESLAQIAVTGTNGKSSVTHYLAELSQRLNHPAGLIGTLGCGRLGALTDTGLTTPDAVGVQRALRMLADQQCERVAMEASSHALDQGRLDGCHIRAAVFTNLTRDHLDYHGSMSAYAASKARLFQRDELEVAIVNAQDPLARLMTAGVRSHVKVVSVGRDATCEFRIKRWRAESDGQSAVIKTPEGERTLTLALMGRFNLDNVLLAIATLYALGDSLDALWQAAATLTPVPGRMQRLKRAGCPVVVVDYAHTPNALENALVALKAHVPGRLWCVVGCGGDRDRGKRPVMASIAEQHADDVVITDDNPRSESPEDIRAELQAGLNDPARALNIEGRSVAIETVITRANADDVILIAGKGHETYQEIAGVRHPFSDVEIALQALETRDV